MALAFAFEEAVLPLLAVPGQSALWLGRLALTDFRNYGHGALAVDRRPVVLTGPNGAGKTNLLEAISFLVPGRGLRQARLSEVDRVVGGQRGGAWAVAATVCRGDNAVEIGTGRDSSQAADAGRERRLVKINGAFVSGPSALGNIWP